MDVLKNANHGLRFLVELCTLAVIGYWAFSSDKAILLKILLGIGMPLLAAVIWGKFVAPKASMPATGITRLLLEVIILGSGIIALYAAGNNKLALIYGIVVLVNLTFTYVWKQHLTL